MESVDPSKDLVPMDKDLIDQINNQINEITTRVNQGDDKSAVADLDALNEQLGDLSSGTSTLRERVKELRKRIKPKDNVIKLSKVHLSLGSGAARVHILKGIDLEIERGERVGVVGPSGSGKSTLLMVMGGLERVDEGIVEVADQKLNELDEDDLAKFRGQNIGIVFQSFHLIPNMTAHENVAVPLELAGDPDAFEKAEEELNSVGLGDRLLHYPAELSGGEQQRVAIARSLISHPSILIADEPTGNLDDTIGNQIIELMFAASRKRNTTLVLVTHDTNLASKCDRTVRVRSGQIEQGDNQGVEN